MRRSATETSVVSSRRSYHNVRKSGSYFAGVPYTPNSGFTGTDDFTIQANDGAENSNVATITLNVTPYAPLNADGSYSVLHDHTLPNINFALNDSDANGDPTAIVIVSGSTNGTLTQNSDGTYNYTPEAHYYGADTVTISVAGGTPVTVTINVTDIAPVATNTTVDIEAYDGVYSGMALLADAVDSDGDALTIDFLSEPQNGLLALNPSTGLYDYTATTGYLGQDSFSFQYYDGAMYSATVNVDILDYDDTTNFATDSYVQGFAGLVGAAFNGNPSGMGIYQGNLNDCWFIAAEAGLAEARPNALIWSPANPTGLIQVNNNGTYTVRFAGGGGFLGLVAPPQINNMVFSRNQGNTQMSHSNPNNGDWSAILEQAWATANTPRGLPLSVGFQNGLNLPNLGGGGIRYLTGNNYTFTLLAVTPLATTIANLTAALNPANPANAKVVTATSVGGGGGLSPAHVYTVLAYNVAAQTVTVRNPWGLNDASVSYNRAPLLRALALPAALRPLPLAVARFAAGNDIRGVPVPGTAVNTADFTMPLNEFDALFSSVDYEN